MSMLGSFRQISPALLERIKAEPALAEAVVRARPAGGAPANDIEAYLSLLPGHLRAVMDEMAPEMRSAFVAELERSLPDLPPPLQQQIAAARAPAPSGGPALDPEDLGRDLHIEKAWHGVHFLLCGVPAAAPPPLGDAVLGGAEVGPDAGYGPARYLEAEQVAALAAALQELPPAEVADRYDAVLLDAQEIYPDGWSGEDRVEWMRESYARLRDFYLDAGREGLAVLLWIS